MCDKVIIEKCSFLESRARVRQTVKGQIVNIVDLMGQTVSVTSSQLIHCGEKPAMHMRM